MSAERWPDSLAELEAFGNPFLALQGEVVKEDADTENSELEWYDEVKGKPENHDEWWEEDEEDLPGEETEEEEEQEEATQELPESAELQASEVKDVVVEEQPQQHGGGLGVWGTALGGYGVAAGVLYEEDEQEWAKEEEQEDDELEQEEGEGKGQAVRVWSQADIDKWYNDPMNLQAESQAAKMHGVPWSERGPRFGPEEGGPTTWRGSVWRPNTKKWATRGGRNLKYWSQLYSKKGKDKGKGSSASSSSSASSWQPNPFGKGKSKDLMGGKKGQHTK